MQSKISMNRRYLFLFLLTMLSLLAVPIGFAQELSGEPIQIGIAVAQTSNVALLGQEQVIGAQIAQEFFNERGGINGRPIELVFQDTAGDEAGAINAFQTLISAGVVGIVGPTLSQQAFASDPLAEQAGVPVLAPSNTAAGIPQIGNYIARVSAPVAVVAPNAVQAALDINPDIARVAVFYAQNDAFSTSESGTFQQTITDLGLELLPVQTFQTSDTDFSSQITNMLSLNPDLAIISGLAADGGNLVRQLREQGYEGLIIGGNGLNTANIYPVCQQFCDGIIIAQAYSYAADSEINRAFRDVYFEQQGKEPPQFSAQAFTGVQVFVEALIALDNAVGLDTLELADLRTQLNTQILAGSYDTPLGTISFTEEGELIQAQFYVAQIQMNDDGQTGQFVFLDTGDTEGEATPEATEEASVCEPGEVSGEPIQIGIAVAQTSNVALLGQEQVIGAQIAQEFFNNCGGVNGRPIELVFQDTAGDEAGAINAFQTLISAGVVGIVGPTLSQQAFASDPLAEQAGVPVLAPSNTAAGIPQIGNYIARVSAPVAVVAPNAVQAALDINPDIARVAVFYAQNDAFSTSESGTFQQTITDLGLELLPVQTFQTSDTDFSSQITNMLSLNPDLAIISGLAADGGNLVRQLREQGYEGLIIGGNGLNTANIYPVCQQFCDGIIIAQAYSYAADTPINQAFRDVYFEQQGKEPPQFSAQAFTGVQVFVEALIALDDAVGLDTLELADLRAQLNTQILAGSYDTPLGTISFTEEGELIQAQFYVAQIQMNDDGQTGQFVFIR